MMLLLQSAATGNLPPVATDTTAILTASAVSVWIIQKLKTAHWFQLLTPSTATLNRLASIIAALLTATGIHVAFSMGTLTISGLTVTGIIGALIAWFKSFVMNEILYQVTANKKMDAEAHAVAEAAMKAVAGGEAAK